MKKHLNSLLMLILTTALVFGVSATAWATVSPAQLDKAVNETAAYVQKTVTAPTVGSIGGDWAVLALARSGCEVPQSYYDNYYNRVVKYVQENKGVLHARKYTEYSRVVLALTAIGKDPANVGGYNLLTPLGDYEKTVYQGINGAVFALIALDSKDYQIPVNSTAKVQATREMYVNYILSRQLTDGGWALSGEVSDPDVTAMVLQALANYQNQTAVKTAVDKGVACLSQMQDNNGGYASWGTANCESTCQVIVALTALGIDLNDARFVKNGKSLLDNLMSYYTVGGGFQHSADISGNNGMTTEQGLYALAAAKRAMNNQNSLYDMSDVAKNSGLSDIQGHKNQTAIEALTAKGIINGMPDGTFRPNATMTRAEFATIVVKALGLTPKEQTVFNDVKAGAWYSGYIGTAYSNGIVKGVSATMFSPNSTITKEEAAVMVDRAATICGLNDSDSGDGKIAAIIDSLNDGDEISSWAKAGVANCYDKGIMPDDSKTIQPKKAILRCEIAQMVYNMLKLANRI